MASQQAPGGGRGGQAPPPPPRVPDKWKWPEKPVLLGTGVKRLDAPDKVSGRAKYTYDINLKNQLIAKGLGCPHAHCKILSIDTSAAEKLPGVVKIEVLQPEPMGDKKDWEIEWLSSRRQE